MKFKKKLAITVLLFFFSMCTIVPINALAATNDDIYDVSTDSNQKIYDIWNYINNELMPKVQQAVDAANTAAATAGGSTSASSEDITNIKDSVSNVQNSLDNINVSDDAQQGVQNYFDSQNTVNDGSASSGVFAWGDTFIGVANLQWKNVAESIQGNGVTDSWGFSLSPKSYSSSTLD